MYVFVFVEQVIHVKQNTNMLKLFNLLKSRLKPSGRIIQELCFRKETARCSVFFPVYPMILSALGF